MNKGPPKHIGTMLVLAIAALFVGLLNTSSSGTQASASTGPVMSDTMALASADVASFPTVVGPEAALTSTTLIDDVALIDTSTASEVLANESGSSGNSIANAVAIDNGTRFRLSAPDGVLSIAAPAAAITDTTGGIYSNTGLIGLDAQTVFADPSGGSGANILAASVDEITATFTGISNRFIGATASVLGTDMALDGALPLTATLAAIAVTTLAFWYLFRRTRDGPNDDGPADDTILDTIYVALRSGMRSALGRVTEMPTLDTGAFTRGHSPLLA